MRYNRNFIILSIIAFLQGLLFYGPVATLYREARGITIYEIFILESVFMLVLILLEIPWGWFADRFGYRKTLFIAFLLNFIAKILFYFAHSFTMFLIERVIFAVSLSGVSGCDSALLYSAVGEEKSEKAFSWYNAFSTLGFLIATLVSGFIISISMDFSVLLSIFPYGLAVILSLFLKDMPHGNIKKETMGNVFKIVAKSRGIIPFLLSMAIIAEVSHSILVFLNQLQYKRSGIPVIYFGIILAVVQTASMVTAKTHKITSRFGRYRTLIFISCSIAFSSFALAFTANPAASILMMVIIGIASSIAVPISLDIQNRSIILSNRATVLSAYAMIIDVFSAAINLAVGKAAALSLQSSLLLCGILAVLALPLGICYFRAERVN